MTVCSGAFDGHPATYPPTVIVFNPDAKARWQWCPDTPESRWLAGERAGVVATGTYGGNGLDPIVSIHAAASGELRWWAPDLGAPAMFTGNGQLRSADGHNFIDIASGATTNAPGTHGAVLSVATSTVIVSVAAGNDAFSGTLLTAKATHTGRELWSRSDLGVFAVGGAVLTVDRDTVIAATSSGVAGLDLATGTDRWRVTGELAPLSSSGTSVVRAGAFFVKTDAHTEAHAVTDGHVLWVADGIPTSGSPTGTGDATDVVGLQRLDGAGFNVDDAATGTMLWTAPTEPFAVGESTFVEDAEPNLSFFGTRTGTATGTVTLPCLHTADCTLQDGYIAGMDIAGADVVVALNDFSGA